MQKLTNNHSTIIMIREQQGRAEAGESSGDTTGPGPEWEKLRVGGDRQINSDEEAHSEDAGLPSGRRAQTKAQQSQQQRDNSGKTDTTRWDCRSALERGHQRQKRVTLVTLKAVSGASLDRPLCRMFSRSRT